MSEKQDNEDMLDGIEKILKKKEYDIKKAAPKCEHEDDGYVYGVGPNYITLRCRHCGVYYDKPQ